MVGLTSRVETALSSVFSSRPARQVTSHPPAQPVGDSWPRLNLGYATNQGTSLAASRIMPGDPRKRAVGGSNVGPNTTRSFSSSQNGPRELNYNNPTPPTQPPSQPRNLSTLPDRASSFFCSSPFFLTSSPLLHHSTTPSTCRPSRELGPPPGSSARRGPTAPAARPTLPPLTTCASTPTPRSSTRVSPASRERE